MTREFKGWHMAVIIVSFFTVTVAVNLTLAFFARASFPGLVVANSYVASQNFNRDLEVARRQHGAGWQVKIEAGRAAARISILDGAGKPIGGLQPRAVFARPATSRDDTSVDFRETAPGVYAANAALQGGVWNADITVAGGPETMRFFERIVVK